MSLRFDRRIFVNRSDMFEGEIHYREGEHPGTLRLLGFLNHANAGDYAAALRLAQQTGTVPDVTATRRNGTLKYGTGVVRPKMALKSLAFPYRFQ